MTLDRPVIGKCILCGDKVYKTEKRITSEKGICHQRCLYSSGEPVQA